jgi:arsenate reductase
MVRIYTLKTCDSCRKATKWLREKGIPFTEIPIRENPPTKAELCTGLKTSGDIRKLFNTSGQDYRKLGMKDRLPTLSKAEAISLLASNGNLIKRPFLISDGTTLVGFAEDTWAAAFP